MNLVHLHLVLNHLPIVGTIFALLLLAAGLFWQKDELKKAAMWAFCLVAAFAIPAYLTGEPAEEVAEKLPGVTETIIERHEDAAKIALILVLSLGTLSGAGLIATRAKPVPRWLASGLLAVSLTTSGLMAWTGNLGGQIRHTEIRAGAPALPPQSEKEHR